MYICLARAHIGFGGGKWEKFRTSYNQRASTLRSVAFVCSRASNPQQPAHTARFMCDIESEFMTSTGFNAAGALGAHVALVGLCVGLRAVFAPTQNAAQRCEQSHKPKRCGFSRASASVCGVWLCGCVNAKHTGPRELARVDDGDDRTRRRTGVV